MICLSLVLKVTAADCSDGRSSINAWWVQGVKKAGPGSPREGRPGAGTKFHHLQNDQLQPVLVSRMVRV